MGTSSQGAATLRCAECGQPVVRRRSGGRFAHRSRVVAACDLDADHAAVPDWAALGELPCRRCGAPTVAEGGAFTHLEAEREADHPADPALSLG
jgi:hypothetical protein